MKGSARPGDFAFDSPHDAISAVIARVEPVSQEVVSLSDAFGRVLSQSIKTDRDSPPHDVSAMDGYAVGAGDLCGSGITLQVIGEAAIGCRAPEMPATGCLKISTGACVPAGCAGVIPRELVEEHADRIVIDAGAPITPGQHIRRRGENAQAGCEVVAPGSVISAAVAGALAAFGSEQVSVYRPINVAVVTTGDELLPVGATPEPWQIRDSNTSALLAGLSNRPWIRALGSRTVDDQRSRIVDALRAAADEADLVITTGGVSMGDHDHVKDAVTDLGGQVIFHKLPIRPGKPCLAGLLPLDRGQSRAVPIMGLPGNPVAVAVGLAVLVGPVMRALGGWSNAQPGRKQVKIINPPKKKLGLWRYLPAQLTSDGQAHVLGTKGSGDLAAAAGADGYVQIPPDGAGPGPWLFYDGA